MNITLNGTSVRMVNLKWVYLQIIPLGMAVMSNRLHEGLQTATLIAALCTAVLLMAAQWHRYRLARRQDAKQKAEHETFE